MTTRSNSIFLQKWESVGFSLPSLILIVGCTAHTLLIIVWNNHGRIAPHIAQAHIDTLSALTPPVFSTIGHDASASAGSLEASKAATTPSPDLDVDLDSPDEIAIRALLLGIHYRTVGKPDVARRLLEEAVGLQSALKASTWVGGVASFEIAVLDLKEAQTTLDKRAGSSADLSRPDADVASAASSVRDSTSHATLPADAGRLNGNGHVSDADAGAEVKRRWTEVLERASARLDVALSLATSSVDLSSRLDSRVAMLRDEIATKREMLKIAS
jgi:hypothetical protein